MTLKPVPGERGLWENEDLEPGANGVHALIFGISRYDYLGEGAHATPGAETYGLGQLAVSAATALRVFGWLRSDYVLNGSPVARVRMLLSPQRKGIGGVEVDELQNCDPAIVAHAPEANFENCKTAIENWYGEMKELRPPAIARSLLFFSGHGVQLSRANQLLLPSDYGRPRGSADEAIRTQNLFECLASLPSVPSHVCLLDACRNDIEKLRRVDGTNVITDFGGYGDPRLELRVLRATASGLRAYQPRTPGGMSLFGQALLDGLSAKPNPVLGEAPIELFSRGKTRVVDVDRLHVYMNGRIDALIRNANECVVQVVRSDDSQSAAGRVEMTELEPVAATELAAMEGAKAVEEVMFESFTPDADPDSGGSHPIARLSRRQITFERPGAWFKRRYDKHKRRPSGPPDDARLHDILGSEAFTTPWLNAKLVRLSTGRALDLDRAEIVSASQTANNGTLHGVQIQIRLDVPDPVGTTLTIGDFAGQTFTTVLPSGGATTIFQLEIDRIHDSYIRFAPYLSPLTKGAVGAVATAWDTARALTAASALKGLQAGSARPALSSSNAPLVSAIVAGLLLQANRLDLMREPATGTPTLPDEIVFWTEQRRRAGGLDLGAAAWFVNGLLGSSLPFTADAFGIATTLLGELDRGRLSATNSVRVAAAQLKRRFDTVLPFFRDDGLFCTYVDLPPEWDHAMLLGPRSSRRRSQSGAVHPRDGMT